uniref:GRB2-associated and regulator of MAPK protein 1-like n=1 Tax=Myxine glutinosa TaxID=7769 RepID=UPI00358F3912
MATSCAQGAIRWSSLALPLDEIVHRYKLPQLVRAAPGPMTEGLQDGDLVLLHSARQWTTVLAHSLEEGHYVVGPKIEIPIHYPGKFKLLEQDRDSKEPMRYFGSVEEVAKAFPDRVFVMEDISFSVKVGSGEFSEDSEVYNFTLCAGDELTLMGQAEIFCCKSTKDRFKFNSLVRKIGRLGTGSPRCNKDKMPCLICMNHRTNESLSLPFQCRGRFGTRSPHELRLQDGEHTMRSILEQVRLPLNVQVPSRHGFGPSPTRNSYDRHNLREGHRYKLVGLQVRTVVVCCVIRPNNTIGQPAAALTPLHFPLQLGQLLPRFQISYGLLAGEKSYQDALAGWLTVAYERFDPEEYSRAIREALPDTPSPKVPPRSAAICSSPAKGPGLPLARFSLCFYGNSLHGNIEVQRSLPSHRDATQDRTVQSGPRSDGEYVLPEDPTPNNTQSTADGAYEELWTDGTNKAEKKRDTTWIKSLLPPPRDGIYSSPRPGAGCLLPPRVPPKSEAVKQECRSLVTCAPPIPPRGSKTLVTPSGSPRLQACSEKLQTSMQTHSSSPSLSFYSSGLHNMLPKTSCGWSLNPSKPVVEFCYPCGWSCERMCLAPSATELQRPSLSDCQSSKTSWSETWSVGSSESDGSLCHSSEGSFRFPAMNIGQQGSATPRQGDVAPSTISRLQTGTNDIDVSCCKSTTAAPIAPFVAPDPLKTLTGMLDMQNTPLIESPPGSHCINKQPKALLRPALPHHPTNKIFTTATGNQQFPFSPPQLKKFGFPTDISGRHSSSSSEVSRTVTTNPPFPNASACAINSTCQLPTELVGLSVENVCNCLRFLSLREEVIARFLSERIDGNVLAQLTEEMLLQDFQLNRHELQKVLEFTAGWRYQL